jgi:glutathione S-transferase
MKLLSANISPFASRIRLAVYAKGLPVEIDYPPGGGLKSPEYLALNPMGKAPCLLGEGFALPESAVILEYLEDLYPATPLLPADPEGRARVRLIARIGDLYVGNPAFGLFAQMNPATRDEAVAKGLLDKVEEGLGWLECYIADTGYAAGGDLTIADCTIVPPLSQVPSLAAGLGRPGIMDRFPKLAAYMGRVAGHPAVAKVLVEMGAAAKTYQETGKIT